MKRRTLGSSAVRRLASLCLFWLAASCVKQAPPAGESVPAPASASPNPAPHGKWGSVVGKSLLSAGGVRAMQLHGKAERVALTHVKVEGQPFQEAARIEVKQPSENPWDVQIQAPTALGVEKGDVMLATFYFRTERSFVESGEGDTEFVFELARDPWTKSASYPVQAGREWRKVQVRYVAEDTYEAGQAQMIFRLGYKPQVIEIGGVSVETFGKSLALSELPETKLTYRGREADAPWRAAAEARIEQHRKGDLTVLVKDKAGKPVPNAELDVKMTRHAYKFGTAVQAELIASGKNPRYLEAVKELFNFAVLENDLKWQPLAGDWGGGFTLERASKAVDWLKAQGIGVRGHVLVWPSYRNLPASLKELESDKPKLRAEVKKHVRELATAMRGKLEHWDVMNEPFDNNDLMRLLGDEVMVEWFREARAADPKARLFINDYAILSGGGGSSAHRDHYEKTIRFLLGQGAPLDAIGLQGHFGNALTSPEDMLAILERFAAFQKPLYVTEYDVVVADEELAGDFTRDLLTLFFSHPLSGGFLMWGFWDGAHWKKNAPLYRADFSPKPAEKHYRELVLGKWWTRARGKTDDQGGYALRGFQGEYAIAVKAGEKTATTTASLDADGTSVVVTLP